MGVKNLPLDSWLGNPVPLVVGTTNGSSNVDLALIGNYTSILLGDGNGGFTYGNSYDLAGFPSGTETGTGGKTDLVVSASPGFSVLEGNGNGTFKALCESFWGRATSPPPAPMLNLQLQT